MSTQHDAALRSWYLARARRAALSDEVLFKSTPNALVLADSEHLRTLIEQRTSNDETDEKKLSRQPRAVHTIAATIGLVTGLCLYFANHPLLGTTFAAAGLAWLAASFIIPPRDAVQPDVALQQQLKEASERERLISDFSADVHFALSPDLQVLAVNPATKKHWGYETFAVVNRTILDFVAEHDRQTAQQQLGETISHGGSILFEVAVRAASGKLLDTQWEAEFSSSANTLYCIVTDISERKQAQRLKQRLFAMLGHDLRAPLAAAHVSVRNIKNDHGTDNELLARLSKIESCLSRVIGLSHDMLALQQCEEGKLSVKEQIVSIPELLEEIRDELGELFAISGQTLVLDEQPLMVLGDEDRIKQILINFLSNANKYAGEGATIRVSQCESQGAAEITVNDSGPGVPSDKLSLLFEPYARLQEHQDIPGTGLGLVLTRHLARAQGGTVGVRKSDLGGACFWLRLPLETVH